jgi:ribokinase
MDGVTSALGLKQRIAVVYSTMVNLATYVERIPEGGEAIEAPRFEMGFGGRGTTRLWPPRGSFSPRG